MDPTTFVQAIVLGIVQGATEFLPISSSGHLVLVPWALGWPDLGLAFDAVVHWGTLVAVVLYFRRELVTLLQGAWAGVYGRGRNPNPGISPPVGTAIHSLDAVAARRLPWLILLGTVPAVVAGLLFEDWFARLFTRPAWAAGFLLVTGLVLVSAERLSATQRTPGRGTGSLAELTVFGAMAIGIAQAFAIAPGISRSGTTIAAGLLVGLPRPEAARFSFLLAIPVILGAGALELLRLWQAGGVAAQVPLLVGGFLAAAITGYVAIRFLLDYLRRHTLYLFALYCWVVGIGALLLTVVR